MLRPRNLRRGRKRSGIQSVSMAAVLSLLWMGRALGEEGGRGGGDDGGDEGIITSNGAVLDVLAF